MAIAGLGTDIVEIVRIENLISQSSRLAERILTPTELQLFEEHNFPAQFLAKRFAAKEAASKALGTGIAHGVTFHDFTISNDENGKPLLILSGKALALSQQKSVSHIHLTISDERHYAVATVILES